jgi:hypothetical protein
VRYLAFPAVLILAATCFADPAPKDKFTSKFEYAELSYRTVPGRPKGVDANGKEVEAVAASMAIRWTTGAEEVTVKGWDELAEKLKVDLKKEGSASFQRLQVLNALGASGWELVEQESNSSTTNLTAERGGFGRNADIAFFKPASSTLLFKRRVQ